MIGKKKLKVVMKKKKKGRIRNPDMGKNPEASTSSPPPPWVELPAEITANILHRLRAIEILENAQKVCKTWRKVCLDASMWRVIDIRKSDNVSNFDLEAICRHAVDLSQGQLVDINIEKFGSYGFLRSLGYISERSGQLRRLRLVFDKSDQLRRLRLVFNKGLIDAVKKFPLLEDLQLYFFTSISKESIKTIGQCCPLLKSFKLNRQCRFPIIDNNEEALAIAESMPELRSLQLLGNKMANDGLEAILNGCHFLESLDIRQCFNVNLGGDLGKRCFEQVKDVRHPFASTKDYEFAVNIHYSEYSNDYEEDSSGFHDSGFETDYDEFNYDDFPNPWANGNYADFGGFFDDLW